MWLGNGCGGSKWDEPYDGRSPTVGAENLVAWFGEPYAAAAGSVSESGDGGATRPLGVNPKSCSTLPAPRTSAS